MTNLRFETDGAEHFAGAALDLLPQICRELAQLPKNRAGIRLFSDSNVLDFLTPDGAIGGLARDILGRHARAVRAIYFDKSYENNWSLSWHQDRTICVKERIEVQGFGPWTIKDGKDHVAPPFDLLAQMITLRLHIDDVPATNAPLLIAPRSHKMGIIREDAIHQVVGACGVHACLARSGDIWVYSTPIVHASERASIPGNRRVVQIDFSAQSLPGGLEWNCV